MMDKNQLFTIILIIIFCIIIYLYYSKKIDYKYGSEKFNLTNKQSLPIYHNDTPNFVQDYMNGTTNSSPNYKFENVTQYNYEKLLQKHIKSRWLACRIKIYKNSPASAFE